MNEEHHSTHHLFRHCFGVRVSPIAFETETQNPRADRLDLPSRFDSSSARRSWTSTSNDQAPWTDAASEVTQLGKSECSSWAYLSARCAYYGNDRHSQMVNASPILKWQSSCFRVSGQLSRLKDRTMAYILRQRDVLPSQLRVLRRIPLPCFSDAVMRASNMMKDCLDPPLVHGTG